MMDTGRISLPSIDTMLNSTSTPIDLQQTDTLSPGANKDYHRSSQSQQPSYHHYHHPPPVSPSLSSSSSSLDSLPWRGGHSRSISLDSNQVMASTFSSKLSPPRIGASVPPSHQGSAISTTMSPSSPSSLSSISSSSSSSSYHLTGGINENHRHHPYPRPLPPPPLPNPHHLHNTNPTSHHRRAISTSYINTLPSGGKSHNNNMNIGSNGTSKHVISSFMDTPQRKYLCHECYKSFSRPSSLRTHMFSHSGEKPFACPHPGCDRTFSVQSNMRRHIRVHYSASLASPK